jgi:hypothetical protein
MWERFKDWTARPFSADMDAAHWFYFIGLLIVLMVGWRLVLRTIKEVVE